MMRKQSPNECSAIAGIGITLIFLVSGVALILGIISLVRLSPQNSTPFKQLQVQFNDLTVEQRATILNLTVQEILLLEGALKVISEKGIETTNLTVKDNLDYKNDEAEQGDVLTFINGTWQPSVPQLSALSLMDIQMQIALAGSAPNITMETVSNGTYDMLVLTTLNGMVQLDNNDSYGTWIIRKVTFGAFSRWYACIETFPPYTLPPNHTFGYASLTLMGDPRLEFDYFGPVNHRIDISGVVSYSPLPKRRIPSQANIGENNIFINPLSLGPSETFSLDTPLDVPVQSLPFEINK